MSIDATRFTNMFLNILKMNKVQYEVNPNNSIVVGAVEKAAVMDVMRKMGFEHLEGTKVHYKDQMAITVTNMITGRVRFDISLIKDL